MKLLFERLCRETNWDMKTAIHESITQLTATTALNNKEMPPGILNFGMRHMVDVASSNVALKYYGETLTQQINQFEPRLRQVKMDVIGKQLQINAQLFEQVGETVSWSMAK